MTSRTSARTDCWGGGGEAGQPLGTGVFGQFSLAGNRVASLHWQPAFFWQEIILVTSNGIKIKEQKRAREKRRRNWRNLSEEILQRSRGRRTRENFNENQRKAKRHRARVKPLFVTVSFQVMFSFLIYATLPHIFCKTRFLLLF